MFLIIGPSDKSDGNVKSGGKNKSDGDIKSDGNVKSGGKDNTDGNIKSDGRLNPTVMLNPAAA